MSLLNPHKILRDPNPTPGGGGNPTPAPSPAPTPNPTPSPAPTPSPTPAPTPKPFYEGLYGADGKIDKGALDRLPDHLKPHKDWLGKYDNIEALIQGGATAHSLAVKKALAPLTGNEPPEVVAERKTLLDTVNNVPKDAKGYGIARPETLPAEFWNEEAAGKFGALAQKHSISPAAVKELLALQVEMTESEIARGRTSETEFYTKQDNAFASGLQKLGMDAERGADLANRGAATLGIDPKNAIFKNADVRLALVKFATLVSEDKLVRGTEQPGGGQSPIDQARDIVQNPQNPLHKAFHDPNDPRNESVKEKVNALYRTAPARGGL